MGAGRRAWLRTLGGIVAGPAALLAILLIVTDAASSTLQLAAVVAALAVSFQVVYGLLGELSLGHAALFGAGAYTYAALTVRGHGIPLSLVAAGVVGVLVGVAVAAITVRLSEAYFAVATFAIASLLAVAVRASASLGRDDGIIGVVAFSNLPGLTHIQSQLAYTGLAFLGVLAVFLLFRRSRSGLGLETVRTSAWLAKSLGINVSLARVVATGLSGLLAGVVGGVFAQQARFVSPDVFGFYYIVTPLAVLIIGGVRRTAGVIAGVIVVVVLPEMLGFSPITKQIFAAILLFVVVLMLPGGIVGGVSHLLTAVRSRMVRRETVVSSADVATLAAPVHPKPQNRSRTDQVIRAEGVTVRFGALTAVSNVSLSVAEGEVLGLIGANGAGKSTFVNAVSGLVPAAAGRLWINGKEATRWPSHVRARAGLARTFQQVLVADDLSVRQNLLVAQAQGRFWRPARTAGRVEEVAADCGVAEYLDREAGSLSFMHRRLLTIAMALAPEPVAIMLDEATAGLSDDERGGIGELVLAIARNRGTAFIVIEHDVAFVTSVSHRVAVMNYGELLVEGASEVVLADPEVIRSYLGTG